MSFKKHFSVFPHGVQKSDSNQICAVFKLMVTLSRSETDYIIDLQKEWNQLKIEINNLRWSYKFDEDTLTINSGLRPAGKELKLIHRSGIEDEITSEFFRFGEGYRGKSSLIQYHDGFQPLFDKVVFQWKQPSINPFPNQPLRQMGTETEPNDNNDELNRTDPYSQILAEANEYSKLVGEKDLGSSSYNEDLDFDNIDKQKIQYSGGDIIKYPDLMPTYAAILEEPEAAEIRFGVIREFRIPIENLLNGREKQTYNLLINNSGTDREVVKCRILKNEQKYFHGLEQFVFDKGLFNKVSFEYTDPYNTFLNKADQKNHPHPDGLYLVVEYDEGGGDIGDPFENDSIKGFNVVTKLESGNKYYSLSYHEKIFEFLNKENFEYSIRSSGVLSPQGEILTSQSRYRSNVLFAWRGDNLIVNRTRTDSSYENGQFDQMETISEHEIEGFMVNEELFIVDDKLVSGSQIQLYDRGDEQYQFYLRTVTPTGYCVPLQQEIDLEDLLGSRDYLLSFDELVKIENVQKFISAKFDVRRLDQVPIKTLTMLGIGPNGNRDGSEELGGHQHIVLKERFEFEEEACTTVIPGNTCASRLIYPPKIKFEDFRFHGWLSSQYLNLGSSLDHDRFVEVCLNYEKRAMEKIPIAVSNGAIEPFKYLSDLRGKLVSFLPGDLFTLNYLYQNNLPHSFTDEVFDYESKHPYYESALPSELTFSKENNSKNNLLINGKEIYESLEDGIFTFRNYCANSCFNNYGDFLESHYSFIEFKAASVVKPPKPEMTLELEPKSCEENLMFSASRTTEYKWQNSWFYNFEVKDNIDGSKLATHLWQSIKFQETITALRLTEDDEKLQELVEAAPPYQALLSHEYPYEMFLVNEPNNQLKTSIIPLKLIIFVQVENRFLRGLFGKDTQRSIRIFKLMCNDTDVLEFYCDNNDHLYILLNNDIEKNIKLQRDEKNELNLEYNFESRNYELSLLKGEGNKITLTSPIDPSISVNAFEVIPEWMDHLILNPEQNKLSLDRTNEFIFINDEGHPYFSKKSITLFGSSIFQAYYPSIQDELAIGSKGTTFEIEIPNNVKPKAPVLESDILLFQEHTSTEKFKEYKVGNVVRVLLEKDFMKEGRNKLGIILNRVRSRQDSIDPLICEIGEDITKLTTADWSEDGLLEVIDFKTTTAELQKYYSKNDIGYYDINGETFEVLECTPFYNTQLRNWQVLLPLKLKETETIFVKLKAIKISPGHSKVLREIANSVENPYSDPTSTNWSDVSEATHIPIYNSKSYKLSSVSDNHDELKLLIETASIYKKKTYCILAKRNENPVVNIVKRSDGDSNNLNDFVSFAFKRSQSSDYAHERGKVLVTSDLINGLYLKINRAHTVSILILEFENHDNASIEGNVNPEFINFIPLFDAKGLRLINMAEFKI